MNYRAKTFKISNDDIAAMNRPCVYLFIKAGAVQYVGRSFHGLTRVINAHHHRSFVRSQCDEIRVMWCETKDKAFWLEKKLIFKHHPPHNRPNGGGKPSSH